MYKRQIIDCAPIGAAIDAAVVAKYCDGAIIVIGQGMASARMIPVSYTHLDVYKRQVLLSMQLLSQLLSIMQSRTVSTVYGSTK